jgi:tRNA pseudouridine32 synthase/23S rRNA pseudouridine746 synthase
MPNPNFVYNPPMSPFLTLLYRDDDIIVAEKPSGLLSVPGKALEHKDALITRINLVYPTATVVHRLDMATSGIMVLALNKPSHRAISKQFELRQTKKRYFARVYGHIAHDSGEVNLPLICDWPNRPKQMVDHDNGKPSLTRFQVVTRDDNTTLVALYPVTGRSHQLRVHMLSLGHPILGDRLYAHENALKQASRLQLHAETLQFAHPTSGDILTFSSPVPFTSTALPPFTP